MKISRDSDAEGSLAPEAWSALLAVPEDLMYHDAHLLRHPRSAYRKALTSLSEKMLRVAVLLDASRLQHFTVGCDMNAMLTAYRELVTATSEYYDATHAILRALCSATKAIKIDSQYLDRTSPAGWRAYREATRAYYIDHNGHIANALKHRGAHLDWIYFHSNKEFRPGFVLCDVLKGGVIGPDPAIHPGSNSALSFARELLLAVWWLYRSGELMAVPIRLISGTRGDSDHEGPRTATSDAFPNLEVMLGAVSQLRYDFLPNELRMPCPRVVFQRTPMRLTLEFPGFFPPRMQLKTLKIRSSMGGIDEEHLTYKMPYMGRDHS